MVVLKAIEKAAILDENVLPQLKREVEIHCRLRHANIVNMHAYFHDETHCACLRASARVKPGG